MSLSLEQQIEELRAAVSSLARKTSPQKRTVVRRSTSSSSTTNITNVTPGQSMGLGLIPPGAGQIDLGTGDTDLSATVGLWGDIPNGSTYALIRFEAQCAGLNTGIEIKTRPTGTSDWTRVLYIFPLDSSDAACTNTNDAWVLLDENGYVDIDVVEATGSDCFYSMILVGYWGPV